MKKIITIITIFLFILAMGCSQKTEQSEHSEQMTIEVPELGEVENHEEIPVETKVIEKSTEKPEDKIEPLGSRLSEEETIDVSNPIPEDAYGIMLYADKTMSEKTLTISVGEEVHFLNMDSMPHQILIETLNPDTTGAWDRWNSVSEGNRLSEGESWGYSFSTAGEYVARDRFAGSMRLTITVK